MREGLKCKGDRLQRGQILKWERLKCNKCRVSSVGIAWGVQETQFVSNEMNNSRDTTLELRHNESKNPKKWWKATYQLLAMERYLPVMEGIPMEIL